MKLNGKTTVEVEVRPIDALESLRKEVFLKNLGLDTNCYFDNCTNNVFLETCEYYGSHKSYETVLVPCTDQQKEIVKAFDIIARSLKELDKR
jgi:hypothetical protein